MAERPGRIGRLVPASRVVSLTLLTLFAGCTGSPTPGPSPDPASASAGASASAQALAPEESNRLVVQCLRDRGWDVQIDPDDATSFSVEMAEEQQEAYEADQQECFELNPSDTRGPDAWTTEEFRNNYQREVRLADCLLGLGYDIPQIPTEATWIEETRAGRVWLAYAFLPENIDTATWNSVNQTCPQW